MLCKQKTFMGYLELFCASFSEVMTFIYTCPTNLVHTTFKYSDVFNRVYITLCEHNAVNVASE
jgi:hypothetical protein